jgi:DNA-binding transcriptional regulator YiaG
MTPDQFRAALADLGLSQAGFARMAMVDARTVRRWCDGTRAVPGPVVALLRILMVTDEWREIPLEQWQALVPGAKP